MALTLKPNGSRPADLDAVPIAETSELPELVTAISKGPRAALDAIQRGVDRLRDLITERDELLIAAIDQHKDLSARVTAGSELIANRALEEMHALFAQAMRPTPASSDAAEAPTLTH